MVVEKATLMGNGKLTPLPHKRILSSFWNEGNSGYQVEFVWKNPLQFYPAGLIRINPPRKSQKNPPEGGFF